MYNKAMEEIIERRMVEWQTFLAVNAIYGFGFKALHDYKGKVTPFWALVLTGFIVVFTYVWFIRIYGNAMRGEFSRELRNRIQEFCPEGLVPSKLDAGGWEYWNTRYLWPWWPFRKKCYKDGNGAWPLWGQRGVCFIVVMYAFAFIVALWLYRTRYADVSVRDFVSELRLDYLYVDWYWGFLCIIALILFLWAFDKKVLARPRKHSKLVSNQGRGV